MTNGIFVFFVGYLGTLQAELCEGMFDLFAMWNEFLQGTPRLGEHLRSIEGSNSRFSKLPFHVDGIFSVEAKLKRHKFIRK